MNTTGIVLTVLTLISIIIQAYSMNELRKIGLSEIFRAKIDKIPARNDAHRTRTRLIQPRAFREVRVEDPYLKR